MATNVGIRKWALDLVLEEDAPLVVARSLSVPIMFPVVRKMSVRARRVRGIRLRENPLARAQTLLCDLHFRGDKQGNGLDDSLDGWVDE